MGLNPGLSFIIRCRFLQDGCWRKPLFLLPLLFEFLYPLHHPAERAFCRPPRCEAGVIARIFRRELPPALQPINGQGAEGHGRLYGASRLRFVLAVAETAGLRQSDNVGENIRESRTYIRELKFPHSRRIQKPAAGLQAVKRTSSCRVAPFGVVNTDLLRGDLISCKRLNEGRFANA